MIAQPAPEDMHRASAPAGAPRGASEAALRVLLVDASDRGGIGDYTRSLRAALQAEHADVALAAPAGAGDPDLVLRDRRCGPDVDRKGKARLYALRLRELGPAVVAFNRVVSRARPSIVHAQTEVVPGLDPLVL